MDGGLFHSAWCLQDRAYTLPAQEKRGQAVNAGEIKAMEADEGLQEVENGWMDLQVKDLVETGLPYSYLYTNISTMK